MYLFSDALTMDRCSATESNTERRKKIQKSPYFLHQSNKIPVDVITEEEDILGSNDKQHNEDNAKVCDKISKWKDQRGKNWIPPRSPYNLVQESLYDEPWQLLVATMFLNRTQGVNVVRTLSKFFEKWPTPLSILGTNQSEISQYIRPLGLQMKRANAIQQMSWEYLFKEWQTPKELYGIGRYGCDSYSIFCLGKWKTVKTRDSKLQMYLKYLTDNQKSLGLE